jgi:Leucine-rich repeat (LRR) protein
MPLADQNHAPPITAALQPTEPYLKLRWYQYSLRTLFLLTLVVAIGMSWLTVTMQNQRKQKAVAEAIMDAGGGVASESTWLGKLLRDDSLVRVTLVISLSKPITDSGLTHLQDLDQLRELRLDNAKITDSGLVHLQGLSQLQILWLSNTDITDSGLPHLHGLRQLQNLDLSGTKVTDAGLVQLQRLSNLKWLGLGNTKVSDAGLVHLQGLGQLRLLGLGNTKATDQGVKKLQQALPNCRIVR